MNNTGLRWFAPLVLVLSAVLCLELASSVTAAVTPLTTAGSPPAITPGNGNIKYPDHSGDWATAINARPLFSADRRPIPLPDRNGETARIMPRLAGVIVSQSQRLAFFAAVGGGKPVVAAEGERVGDFILRAIAPDQVTVSGPDGTRLLRPTFDPTPTAPTETRTAAPLVEVTALPIAGSHQTLLDLVRDGPQQ
jgi:hypothetical protein